MRNKWRTFSADVREIADAGIVMICLEFGYTPAQLLSKGNRNVKLAQARQAAWHLLRFNGKMIQTDIAELFGRDHSTIARGITACDNKLGTALDQRLECVRMKFNRLFNQTINQ